MAQVSADTGKLSVGAAREMQVAFLRTGKISADELGRAIGIARNFAATIGVDARQGAEQLAAALADPARGADELNARLSFLDDRTRLYVRTLVDQNRRTEAQRVLLSALAPALADAEQATNAFGRAWGFVARQASNAWDAIGRIVDRAVDGRTPAEELDLLKWQREQLRGNIRGDVVPLALAPVERRIVELERQIEAERQRAAKVGADARANELSVRAGEVAREVVPGAREVERLRREQAILRSSLDDPLARSKLADAAQVEEAYRRVTAELARYRPAVDAATQAVVTQNAAAELAIRATLSLAAAYLESAEAAERSEARRQGLAEQAREGIDAEARARQVLSERVAEAAAQAQQVADRTLAEAWIGRESARFALPPSHVALNPGDEIELLVEGVPRSFRLGRILGRGAIEAEAVRSEAAVYAPLHPGIDGERLKDDVGPALPVALLKSGDFATLDAVLGDALTSALVAVEVRDAALADALAAIEARGGGVPADAAAPTRLHP